LRELFSPRGNGRLSCVLDVKRKNKPKKALWD
jgi:hypothetical protein